MAAEEGCCSTLVLLKDQQTLVPVDIRVLDARTFTSDHELEVLSLLEDFTSTSQPPDPAAKKSPAQKYKIMSGSSVSIAVAYRKRTAKRIFMVAGGGGQSGLLGRRPGASFTLRLLVAPHSAGQTSAVAKLAVRLGGVVSGESVVQDERQPVISCYFRSPPTPHPAAAPPHYDGHVEAPDTELTKKDQPVIQLAAPTAKDANAARSKTRNNRDKASERTEIADEKPVDDLSNECNKITTGVVIVDHHIGDDMCDNRSDKRKTKGCTVAGTADTSECVVNRGRERLGDSSDCQIDLTSPASKKQPLAIGLSDDLTYVTTASGCSKSLGLNPAATSCKEKTSAPPSTAVSDDSVSETSGTQDAGKDGTETRKVATKRKFSLSPELKVSSRLRRRMKLKKGVTAS